MSKNYSEIRSKLVNDKKVIAIAFNPSKDLIAYYKGLLTFLKGVPEKGYQLIFLTIDNPRNANLYLRKEGFVNIFVCSPEEYSELDFVDCFIIWDYCTFSWRFPENSRIITLAHSWYLSSPAHVVSIFGYRADYSFLIGGSKKEYEKEILDIEIAASTIFPYKMLQRNGCLIPGGYPEIDALLNNYHKSHDFKCISFCTTGRINNDRLLPDNGAKIIKHLLESFPEYTIIFRPTPADREMEYVKYIEETFDVFDNFQVDLGDLQETINRSQVLVSDSTGLKEAFAIATSIPYIHCDFSSKKNTGIQKEPLGYKVHSIDDLIPVIKKILNGEKISRKVIDSCQKNVGCSASYLLENISYILEDKKTPEWFYYENKCSDNKTFNAPEDYFPYIQKYMDSIPFRAISLKIIDFAVQDFPDSAFLLGIKAKFHFYRGEFEIAQMYLSKANAISAIETAKSINIQYMDMEKLELILRKFFVFIRKIRKLGLKSISKKVIKQLTYKMFHKVS